MNPSYDNSFGNGAPIVSGGGATGGQMPISSGTGDIILTPSGEKKSKKGLIVGVVVAVVLTVIVVVVGLMATGVVSFGQKSIEGENREFYVILDENQKNVADLTSLLAGMMSGEASLAMFMLPEDEYASQIESLNLGVLSLERVKERVESGPSLSGVMDGIDIGANYTGLKDALVKDLEEYRKFADIVAGLYETFGQKGAISARDTFGEYDGMYDLAVYVDDYFATRNEMQASYIENNCENDFGSTTCRELENAGGELNERIKNSNDIIQRSFAAVFGDLNNEGEGSIIYYLNELYAATGAESER